MNANELAEIIEHLENAKYFGASKAATMLRKLQAENEFLKGWVEVSDQLTKLRLANSAVPVKELSIDDITANEVLDIAEEKGMKVDSFVLMNFVDSILRKAQEADKIESLGTVNIGGVHYRNGKKQK